MSTNDVKGKTTAIKGKRKLAAESLRKSLQGVRFMTPKVEIKVTRCLGAALSDSEEGGWQVSYVERQFWTQQEAEAEAERLRTNPTDAERKAIAEGRFVDGD